MSILAEIPAVDPVIHHVTAMITPERALRYLRAIADTLAPSQTAWQTRAPVVEQLLRDDGVLARPHVAFTRNYRQTGDAVLLLGPNEQKSVWLLTHLDICAYVIEPFTDGCYPLTPVSYHLMQPGRRPGTALRYNIDAGHLEVAAQGMIETRDDGAIGFCPDGPVTLAPGCRVVFQSMLDHEMSSGVVRGNVDDAAGVTAHLLAAAVLSQYGVNVLVAMTDEEEGVAGTGNQSICRGGKRVLRYFDQPELVIVTDIHETIPMADGHGPDNLRPGDGAVYVEKSSAGKGGITPPHLYAFQRRLAEELSPAGISLCENHGGYASRSECVNAMERTPNVALLGFLGTNRHFDTDLPSANLHDIVHLARALVLYVLSTQTPTWRRTMGSD